MRGARLRPDRSGELPRLPPRGVPDLVAEPARPRRRCAPRRAAQEPALPLLPLARRSPRRRGAGRLGLLRDLPRRRPLLPARGGDARQGAFAPVRAHRPERGQCRGYLPELPRRREPLGHALRSESSARAHRPLVGRARRAQARARSALAAPAARRAARCLARPPRREGSADAVSEAVLPAPDTAVSEIARLPELGPNEAHLVVEQVWRFFCSLRLTLANLLLLFGGMIAGTFVNPQNDSLANIEKAFAARPAVLWAYRTFELYDLFHSWWFTLILTSLALNLIACSLERLPRIWFLVRYPSLRLDEVKGLRLRAASSGAGRTPEEVAAALRARGYSAQVLERPAAEGGGADIFAERGRYSR